MIEMWQIMHSDTLGIVAAIERSAVEWQYVQSRSASTCVLCGNAIGCGTGGAEPQARVKLATPKKPIRMAKASNCFGDLGIDRSVSA
jgi:hypothetical protein